MVSPANEARRQYALGVIRAQAPLSLQRLGRLIAPAPMPSVHAPKLPVQELIAGIGPALQTLMAVASYNELLGDLVARVTELEGNANGFSCAGISARGSFYRRNPDPREVETEQWQEVQRLQHGLLHASVAEQGAAVAAWPVIIMLAGGAEFAVYHERMLRAYAGGMITAQPFVKERGKGSVDFDALYATYHELLDALLMLSGKDQPA